MTTEPIFDLIVVGGGAAGFYGAIRAAEMNPQLKILILEKSNKVLSKVRISGGGRCNVTHNCFNPVRLAAHYPRGGKQLKDLFRLHQAKDVVDWFEAKGVKLKAEEDGRMFPVTDSSETIIRCFIEEATRRKIKIQLATGVERIIRQEKSFLLHTPEKTFFAKYVLVAIGGNANPVVYNWIKELGHTIAPPIPSLFTFNDSQLDFRHLMGISVEHAQVRIATTKFSQAGALLITHWGLSGPAVIKLSAWAAEHLHQVNYNFTALVSWIADVSEEACRQALFEQKKRHPKQKITSNPLYALPLRLWQKLCERAEVAEHKVWGDASNKNINRLLENLVRCPFIIKGKTTFKEEFVTCGGVDLKEIDLSSLESKIAGGLFFAGEVLNIDGETGGFNFQAAWTTAYVAAKAIAVK